MLQRIAMGKLQSPKIGPRGKTAIPHKSPPIKPRAACVSHVMMRRCHLKLDVASAFRQLSFYPISLHQQQRLQSRL